MMFIGVLMIIFFYIFAIIGVMFFDYTEAINSGKKLFNAYSFKYDANTYIRYKKIVCF